VDHCGIIIICTKLPLLEDKQDSKFEGVWYSQFTCYYRPNLGLKWTLYILKICLIPNIIWICVNNWWWE